MSMHIRSAPSVVLTGLPISAPSRSACLSVRLFSFPFQTPVVPILSPELYASSCVNTETRGAAEGLQHDYIHMLLLIVAPYYQ